MAEPSSSTSVMWTYIRAITQFQRRKAKTAHISRGRNRQNWSYSHADSFIYKYTTRNFGEVSEDSECDHTESDLEDLDNAEQLGEASDKFEWSRFVVKPDGKFILYWLFFVTCAVLYYLWFLVARDTWLRNDQNYMTVVWLALDVIFDAIYVFDIIIQLRTGYLEHGILVTDGRRLIKKYIKSIYFICDALSLLPVYLVSCKIFKIDRPLLKCPRFLKVYRARQFSSKVESAALHPNGVRIFNLVHVLFLLTHWFAAVYFLVSERIGFGEGDWVHPNTTGGYNHTSRQYLASFYWSTITLTTIGDIPRPESNWE